MLKRHDLADDRRGIVREGSQHFICARCCIGSAESCSSSAQHLCAKPMRSELVIERALTGAELLGDLAASAAPTTDSGLEHAPLHKQLSTSERTLYHKLRAHR